MDPDTAADEIPDGYHYEPTPSAFVNHVGRIYRKPALGADSGIRAWLALRVQPHHVNAWQLCHGAAIASLAEIAVSAVAYRPEDPPVVTVDLNVQFIRAPKLGDLIEVSAEVTRRSRSLVFSQCRAFVRGELVFTAGSVQKILSGKEA
jgi:uncharacterized protein (TIGR00369 family)